MKKIITTGIITGGIIASLLTGITVGAHAQGTIATYFGTNQLAIASRANVIGYAAGVSDTLHSLASTDDAPADPQAYIDRAAQCLDTDAQTIGALADWAIRKWQQAGGRYNAASVMIDQACKL
jgi:hypothetical protein